MFSSKGDFRQLFLSMKFIQINPTLYIVVSYKKNYFEPSKGLHQTVMSHGKGVLFTKLMLLPNLLELLTYYMTKIRNLLVKSQIFLHYTKLLKAILQMSVGIEG